VDWANTHDTRAAMTTNASPAPPRKTVAGRVLASFAVTVAAFAITVGWSVVAERRAAEDSEELAKGYVPVALKLGQLRAAQATLATLVDGIPDERNPLSTKIVLETLTSVRHAKFVETRAAIAEGLTTVGSTGTRELAQRLAAELDASEAILADDKSAFERLFSAIGGGDRDTANRVLVSLGALEHEADRRLHALSDKVTSSMDQLSVAAHTRELRAIYALFALSVLTLGVGVLVSIHTRRLLAPLGRVTERAQAVARGDLTPHEVVPTDDEIGELAGAFERMVSAVARAQSRALSNERLAAIGKMAAHVTHEIRNPLSSIGLNIELLEEELGKDGARGESRALLSAISREVERLEHLSEEYLRVARLPSPRMEAQDVAAAVRDIVAFARPEIERFGSKVEVHVADAVPAALFDEAQLRQALLNLLRNAREAMVAGGPIDVRVEPDGMSVVVSVEDRGGGIPDDIRSRVFDPFFSTKGEGTGLGLAITRQIVEAHGGTITCDVREGGGTRFRIALPIAPSRASGAPRSVRPRKAEPAPGQTR
jgi:two-component system NtrC family sensor kinase